VRYLEARQVFLEPFRLLDGVEVGPVDVLDQGRFEDLLVIEVDDRDRHGRQPGLTGGTEPALPGYQLEALTDPAHNQWLQDTVALIVSQSEVISSLSNALRG